MSEISAGIQGSLQTQERLTDRGRQTEFGSHELVQAGASGLSFESVVALGEQLTKQQLNTVLVSSQPLPTELLAAAWQQGNLPVLGQVRLGPTSHDWFPATIRVIPNQGIPSLELYIAMVTQAMLEASQHGKHTDGQLALAAATAAAPQFLFGLSGGLRSEHCSSNGAYVATLEAGHATPLVTVFESFANRERPGQTTAATQAVFRERGTEITVSGASHLHGHSLTEQGKQSVVRAAAQTRLAGGVMVQRLSWNELCQQAGKFAVYVPTKLDEISGQPRLIDAFETLSGGTGVLPDLGLVAVSLGFTTEVVGESQREQQVEKLLSPAIADTPLIALLNS